MGEQELLDKTEEMTANEIAEECADERRIDALYYGNGAIKR